MDAVIAALGVCCIALGFSLLLRIKGGNRLSVPKRREETGERTGYAFHPPDTLRVSIPAHDGEAVRDAVALESLSYEQLVIFAMDNGFGVPEDGDLHGQNKEQIRQAMLQWLYKKLEFADPDELPGA